MNNQNQVWRSFKDSFAGLPWYYQVVGIASLGTIIGMMVAKVIFG